MGLDLHIFSVLRHPDRAIDSKLTVENFINMEHYFTFKNFEMGETPNALSALEKDALPFYEATYITPCPHPYASIFTKEVYWRKQWQIFQAFYDIAESYGITLDNCDYFEVVKDDIEEVLNKCFVIKKQMILLKEVFYLIKNYIQHIQTFLMLKRLQANGKQKVVKMDTRCYKSF